MAFVLLLAFVAAVAALLILVLRTDSQQGRIIAQHILDSYQNGRLSVLSTLDPITNRPVDEPVWSPVAPEPVYEPEDEFNEPVMTGVN